MQHRHRLRISHYRTRGFMIMPPETSKPDGSLTAADLRAYLETRDDFAFEREIFRHCQGFGFDSVQHAGLYDDPVTLKLRQFDVRATKIGGNHRVRLAIECKSISPAYPLLVSCVPRAQDEAYHDVMMTGDGGHAVVQRFGPRHSAMYIRGEYAGKDMRQVGRDNKGNLTGSDKDLFDKYQQAMASAADLVAQAEREHRVRRPDPTYSVILPILALPDNTLWIARYSSSGELEHDPEQVSEMTFYLGRKYPLEKGGGEYVISHLHVATRSMLVQLLREIGQPGRDGIWDRFFKSV